MQRLLWLPMTRLAGLCTVLSVFASAATAHAECLWRLGWPSDERIQMVPWGTVPRDSFLTKIDCERAIENMLREAIRGQALLVELPACVCVRDYDDVARSSGSSNLTAASCF